MAVVFVAVFILLAGLLVAGSAVGANAAPREPRRIDLAIGGRPDARRHDGLTYRVRR